MKQKLFSLLFAIVASIGTMFAAATKIGDLYYNLNATNKTAEVTYDLYSINNYGGLTKASIPASVTYNGTTYSVTSIGKSAFSKCGGLTSVTIPNSVTSIGEDAFYYCSSLTSVTIPNSVTSIGEDAFYYCSSLTSVTIGNSVTSIGSSAFSFCSSLTSVTIPNSVTSIGNRAFYGCSKLTSATIGNSVTSIREWAFYGCRSLTSVAIGNSVTSIGGHAFYDCKSLTSVVIPNSVISIGDYAFRNCSSLTSVTIPNSVTSIGEGAFQSCSSLTSPVYNAHVFAYLPTFYSGEYTILDGIESIAGGAFSGCSSLTSIEIPNSVTSIGNNAFSNCSALKTVTLNSNNVVSRYYLTTNNLKNVFGDQVTSYIIGDDVTAIGQRAFADCANLKELTIGKSVNNISELSFSGCTNMKTVTLNSNAVVGKDYSYTSAMMSKWFGSQVTKYIIGDDVTRIGNLAFYPSCDNVTMIVIGRNVTYIGQSAFYFCNNLGAVSVLAETPPTISTGVFPTDEQLHWFAKKGSIYVPCGTLDAYKNSWTKYEKYVKYNPTPLFTITTYTNIANAGKITIQATSCETVLEVTNNYGYHFTQWSDGVTANPRTIVLTQDTTITAIFAINQYSINVTCDEALGHIVGESGNFDYLSEHTYEAIPNAGYHFVQWSDGNTQNPRTITVTKDESCQAIFALNQYSINVTCDEALGHIVGESGSFDYLSEHTYEAIPVYGYHFVQWSDGNTQNPRTITVTEDKSCLAIFAINQYSINVTCDEALGHIVGESGSFDYLSEHTYEAIPNAGYHFVQWSDGNTQNPRIIMVTEDMSCQAIFALNQYSINVTCDEAFGHIVGESGSFDYLSEHTYEAIPVYGYHFVQWSDGNTQNPRTITVTEDMSCQAIFALNQYSITVACDVRQGLIEGENGKFDYGSEHVFKAVANTGYEFDGWSDGDMQNPRTIILVADTIIFAMFKLVDAIDVINSDSNAPQIFLRNGQLFIFRDGHTYTIQGQEVR